MAQVANYYYNSPYIADIGRNLASALAPPDPEKQLAIKQREFQLQHAQSEESYQNRERERNQVADERLMELLSMEPEIDPSTGKINTELTDMKARRLLGEIVSMGGRDYYKDASSAAGTASPAYAAQEALKSMAITAAQQNLATNIAARFGMQGNMFEFQRDHQGRDQNFRADQAEKDRQLRRELAVAAQEARLEQIALQNIGKAGGKASSPPKHIIQEITWSIEDIRDLTGKQLTPEDMNRVVDESIAVWQATGNPKAAVNKVWALRFPGVATYSGAGSYNQPPIAPPANWGEAFMQFFGARGGGDGYLRPNYSDDVNLGRPAGTAPPEVIPAEEPAADVAPPAPPKKKPNASAPPAPTKKRKPLQEILGK